MVGTDNNNGNESFLSLCETVWAEQSALPEPRYVTQAPARLDLMGGLADYAGSLVLQYALPLYARVGVAPRNDQKVSITSAGWGANGERAQCVWPLSVLYTPAGKLASPELIASHFDGCGCGWAKPLAGVFYTLLEAGAVPHFGGGACVVAESEIPTNAGVGSSAALAAATAWALTALCQKTVAPIEVARLCQRAENLVAGIPAGITDKVVALLAEPGHLLQMLCQPHEMRGHVELCRGTKIIGIDSGAKSPKKAEKFIETRVASFMGLRIIESLARSRPGPHDLTGGYLANITPTDYVERFRDRLPTKMRGRDFLEEYGHISDAITRIEPETIYKVRSRTEHHVYENDRVHRFAERYFRASRTGERDALVEAGELMYASHWSYSQRCGMGSIETDVLVNLLREQGVARGIFGAKVTGGGCGGTLAVLMMDTPAAAEAVETACRAYTERTGLAARVLSGSAGGAARTPPQRIDVRVPHESR